MPQTVLTVSKEVISKMRKHYASGLKAGPPGSAFAAKTNNCTITAYHSGKVLFQGKAPETEAKQWGKPNSAPGSKPETASSAAHTYTPPSSLFTSSHIGSDEAGTGDYFGPITVAAVFVESGQISFLKEMGIQDSKNLTDKNISSLARALVKQKIPYSLVILDNKKYNNLQRKGWSQGKMKTMLHHHAIHKLCEKIAPVQPEGILIDQFSQPAVYQKHLASEKEILPENTYFMTKAESSSTAVAAASIIARASFVKEMDKLSEQAGMILPKGASAKVDQAAARLLEAKGEAALDNYAKIHFANTKKAQRER